MSPEQAQGIALERRSDIYSLAIILYEALTGKLPFDARSSMEYIQLHVTKPAIHLDQRLADKTFPPGLGDVIAKALAKNPDDRWDTATQFAEALMPFSPTSPASVASAVLSTPQPPAAQPSAPHSAAESVDVANSSTQPAPLSRDDEPATVPRPLAPIEAETGPARTGRQGLSPRTLILVSAVSVLAGIVLAVLALKLLG
jgi:serine/threonine-protein kinase